MNSTSKLLLCASLLATGSLIGKSGSSTPHIPSPTIDEAIALVRKYHADHPGGLKDVFVDQAIYVRESEKAYWKIGVRNTEYETGHLIYTVSPDGKIEVDSVTKDG